MGQILSQEEVDALLKGVADGEVETETAVEDTSGVRPYDLTSHERVVRGRMPTLEIIHERFARIFRVSLSSAMRKAVDVHVTSTDMMKFGEFMKTLPVPTSINIFRMEPLRGFALLILEARLVFALVDHFFGGYGQTHMKVEGREFTAIEQRIIQRVVGMALAELEKAWKPVHDVRVVFTRSEVNPQFAGIVVPTEIVIVVTFEIELESSMGHMTLCLPYSKVETIREKLVAGIQSDQLEVDTRWVKRLRERLVEARVEVVSRLGTGQIPVKALMSLKPGDVLVLQQNADDPLEIHVEGVLKFRGRPGISGGNYALQIQELVWTPLEEA